MHLQDDIRTTGTETGKNARKKIREDIKRRHTIMHYTVFTSQKV